MRTLTSTELDQCAGGVLVTEPQPAGGKFKVGVVEPFDPIGRPAPGPLNAPAEAYADTVAYGETSS